MDHAAARRDPQHAAPGLESTGDRDGREGAEAPAHVVAVDAADRVAAEGCGRDLPRPGRRSPQPRVGAVGGHEAPGVRGGTSVAPRHHGGERELQVDGTTTAADSLRPRVAPGDDDQPAVEVDRGDTARVGQRPGRRDGEGRRSRHLRARRRGPLLAHGERGRDECLVATAAGTQGARGPRAAQAGARDGPDARRDGGGRGAPAQAQQAGRGWHDDDAPSHLDAVADHHLPGARPGGLPHEVAGSGAGLHDVHLEGRRRRRVRDADGDGALRRRAGRGHDGHRHPVLAGEQPDLRRVGPPRGGGDDDAVDRDRETASPGRATGPPDLDRSTSFANHAHGHRGRTRRDHGRDREGGTGGADGGAGDSAAETRAEPCRAGTRTTARAIAPAMRIARTYAYVAWPTGGAPSAGSRGLGGHASHPFGSQPTSAAAPYAAGRPRVGPQQPHRIPRVQPDG